VIRKILLTILMGLAAFMLPTIIHSIFVLPEIVVK